MNPWLVIALLTVGCVFVAFNAAVFLSDHPTRRKAWGIALAASVAAVVIGSAAWRALR